MAKLVLIAKQKPMEIPLGQEVTIGRGYSNLLRLDGEEISRVHAIIYRRDDNFVLRDLDSKNGVFVNGTKVSMTELKAGDAIQIGKHQMFFDPPVGFNVAVREPGRTGGDLIGGHRISGSSESNGGIVVPEPADFERSEIFRGTPHSNTSIEASGSNRLEEVTLMGREELTELCKAEESHAQSDHVYAAIMRRLLDLATSRTEASAGVNDLLLHSTAEALDASGAVIVLLDPTSGGFIPVSIYPQMSDVAVNRVVMREGFSQGRAVLCPNTSECGLFRDSTTVTRDRISTLISVPLKGSEGESGLVYLDRKGEETEPFTVTHLVLLARVARLLELTLFQAGSHVTPPRSALT